jgi:type IV pilus assembly protein PilV
MKQSMSTTHFLSRHAARGFTMVEVLVALIITSVGLLGIAKMQALAYASTGTASVRSLVAIQAASLATTMRANRAYWSVGSAPATITITGTTIDDATLAGVDISGNVCRSGGGGTLCPPATLAAYDLKTWANALNAVIPNSSPKTVINCPLGSIPMNCTIKISWTEKAVAINDQGSADLAASKIAAPLYTLYVEP